MSSDTDSMVIEKRTVSVEDVIKAMALDGYEQGFGHLIHDTVPDDGSIESGKMYKIIDSCAYGQAALNLGVDSQALADSFISLFTDTFILNDDDRLNLKQIARRIKAKFKGNLKDTADVPIAFYEELYTNYQGRKI